MTAWDYDDATLTCPACWADVPDSWDMCGCDPDKGTGPLCPRCCHHHHHETDAAA